MSQGLEWQVTLTGGQMAWLHDDGHLHHRSQQPHLGGLLSPAGGQRYRVVVDVRSNPVSRFAPFANHRVLPDLLESVGIDYELMGGTLGGKPGNPGLYDSKGKPDYRKMRSLDEFQDAVEQLAGMASRRQTVVLCSEEDRSQCHRLLLLGPSLEENGCELLHVRGDGSVQRTGQLSVGKKYGQQLQGTLGI